MSKSKTMSREPQQRVKFSHSVARSLRNRSRSPRRLRAELLENRLLLTVALEYSTLLENGRSAANVVVDEEGFTYVHNFDDNRITKLDLGDDCGLGLEQVCWDKPLEGLAIFGGGLFVDDNSVYVAGQAGEEFEPFITNGAFQELAASGRDAIVAKLNRDTGAIEYATFLGSSVIDTGTGIAVDSEGAIYVAGHTGSGSPFPVTVDSFDDSANGNNEAFVAKLIPDTSLTPSEQLVYSTFIGGSDSDFARDIKLVDCDSSGANCAAIVVGETESSDFAADFFGMSPPSWDASHSGGSDAFVVKVGNDGSTLDAGTFLGGSADDQGLALEVDSQGNVLVTGKAGSSNFPTRNAFQSTRQGSTDAYLTRLNPTLTDVAYSTFLGGNKNDEAFGIALDGNDDVFITGGTTSSNFPTHDPIDNTMIPYDGSSLRGRGDGFIAKIDPDGAGGTSLMNATYLGGTKGDGANGVAIDANGDAHVVGNASRNFPTTHDALSNQGVAYVSRLGFQPLAPVTDIAVSSVSAPSTVVQGTTIEVDVHVTNIGNQNVAADIVVTLISDNGTAGMTMDDFTIGTHNMAGLDAGASEVLTYIWDTENANLATHTLSSSHNFSDDVAANDSKTTTLDVVDSPAEVSITGMIDGSMNAGASEQMTITGAGFQDDLTVSLADGRGPVPTVTIVSIDSTSIVAIFSVGNGGPKGTRTWDVVVTNPDGSNDTLVDGLDVIK